MSAICKPNGELVKPVRILKGLPNERCGDCKMKHINANLCMMPVDQTCLLEEGLIEKGDYVSLEEYLRRVWIDRPEESIRKDLDGMDLFMVCPDHGPLLMSEVRAMMDSKGDIATVWPTCQYCGHTLEGNFSKVGSNGRLF